MPDKITKLELSDQALEAMVAAPKPPAQTQDFSNCSRTGKAYRFFQQINWAEWWDEFLTATQPNGALKYTTAWSFAKEKSENSWQAKIIYECIGPRPEPVGGSKLRVPWLGDWQQRRANGFWCSEDPVKMRYINSLLKEQADARKAARALAPFLIIEMARLQRLAEKIDFAFAGEPFLRDEPPTSPANRKRFWTFFKMHKQVMDQLQHVTDQYLKLFGYCPETAEYWLRFADMSSRKL